MTTTLQVDHEFERGLRTCVAALAMARMRLQMTSPAVARMLMHDEDPTEVLVTAQEECVQELELLERLFDSLLREGRVPDIEGAMRLLVARDAIYTPAQRELDLAAPPHHVELIVRRP